MQRKYTIEIWFGGQWTVAKQGTMSRSAAEGLLSQFAMQYRARLLGENGNVIGHRGVVRS